MSSGQEYFGYQTIWLSSYLIYPLVNMPPQTFATISIFIPWKNNEKNKSRAICEIYIFLVFSYNI